MAKRAVTAKDFFMGTSVNGFYLENTRGRNESYREGSFSQGKPRKAKDF
jgi:hypothetical protein